MFSASWHIQIFWLNDQKLWNKEYVDIHYKELDLSRPAKTFTETEEPLKQDVQEIRH